MCGAGIGRSGSLWVADQSWWPCVSMRSEERVGDGTGQHGAEPGVFEYMAMVLAALALSSERVSRKMVRELNLDFNMCMDAFNILNSWNLKIYST